MQTGMNPDLKKPVGPIALSYSAVDAPKLTDEKMIQLAQEYMLSLIHIYTVQILTKVELKNVNTGMKMVYTIVAESEANLKLGKISVNTPIAQGLFCLLYTSRCV